MKDRLREALKRSTADYVDIRVFVEDGVQFAYRGPEAERASATSSRGGVVRACTKGGWGIIGFDSLDELPLRVEDACRCAALVGRERTELAPVTPAQSRKPAVMKRDFRGVGLDEKIRLVSGYNDILLKIDPAIRSSSARYEDLFRTVYFAASNGTYFEEDRPRVILALSVTARDGSLVQHAYDSFSSPDDYGVVLGRERDAETIARRGVALLKAPRCEAGTRTVILNPKMGGVFVHESFGHLSEADFLYENPRMRDLMVIGREMGGPDLNVADDGTYPGLIGTGVYDDEGTPVTRVPLITAGVLTAHLHSRETAAKMGEKPTGNARAAWKHQPPLVRMRNTFFENGHTPVEALFRGVDRGILACDAFGGQTEFEMFTFSAAYGYRIENGQRGELIRDVVLSGNVFETLKHIDGIGNDFRPDQGGGGCGKGGQGPLPVAMGSPHVRIHDVVVGGQ